MSETKAAAWVEGQLADMDLTGRDELYSHLILQEIPFFYQDTLDGKAIDVEWLIKRRGFNAVETKKLRDLAKFFNDNGLKIRQLWAHLEGE